MASYTHPIRTMAREGWQTLLRKGPGQIQFWFIARLIGIAAGFAALFVRLGISWLQTTLYGTDDVRRIHSPAR